MGFQIVIFAVMLIGIGLVIFSIILFSRSDKKENATDFTADNTIKAIDSSIGEMDKTMDEFNNLAKTVFDEIDQRYQELLFLYSLIDDKKNAIAQLYSNAPIVPPSPQPRQEVQTEYVVSNNTTSNHPMRSEIIRLQRQGLSIAEIAKQLNIGQGEVKLIIELGKAR